jgi:NAD+ kinase
MRRIALVIHPTREIAGALAALRAWAAEHGIEVVQLRTPGNHREVAPEGDVSDCDVAVALGGDGTVLAALRAGAGSGTPVLGVACGSLGALSAVSGGALVGALERFRDGDWTPRSLPVLAVSSESGEDWAVNDLVVIRHGAGQITADIAVDGELYARLAGDGVVVATPLGSSAYSMAAGGPILAMGTPAFLCTPLAPHGGSAPPLVVGGDATVTVDVTPGFTGIDVEIDGQTRPHADRHYRITLQRERITLVTLADVGRGLAGLRRRGLVTDSPRVLARDARTVRDTRD